jgi:hypothetical protein
MSYVTTDTAARFDPAEAGRPPLTLNAALILALLAPLAAAITLLAASV